MLEPSPIQQIYLAYLSLAQTLPEGSFHPTSGLGGKLLYAGEIDPPATRLLYAANIAGAASIAASADPALQRQAIRDGVIDFLVTSLEEALRILKNEIRKHETVSVGVGISASRLTEEMLLHGVLPDLLGETSAELFGQTEGQFQKFCSQGARLIDRDRSLPPASAKFVTWSVDRHFARWLPQLDKCAQQWIPEGDILRQRWLRLAPRYLGKVAQREHGVWMSEAEEAGFRVEAARHFKPDMDDQEGSVNLIIQTDPMP